MHVRLINLLDANDLALQLGAIEAIDSSFSFLRALHGHKAKATRLASVRVIHDRCLLDLMRVSMKGMVRRRVCAYTAKFLEGGLKVAGVYLVAKARNVEVVTGVSAPVATTANRTM